MTRVEEPETPESAALWRFANVEFDELNWELRIGGQPVEMEPRPLEILLCLLRHAGETVTKEELLESVWGHSYLSENALSNAIGKLRKALNDDDRGIIATTHKVGYRLAVPVQRKMPLTRPQARLGLKSGDAVPLRSDWTLEKEVGITDGSEVWLAHSNSQVDLRRVFKFSPDGSRLSSLKREAALSKLLQATLGERDDFVRVLDWGFEQPPFFIECEYGGISLLDWTAPEGGLKDIPLQSRIDLLAQIAEAVALAHSVGVLHKDLKPANILLQFDDRGRPKARITDFGSGTLTDPSRLAEWGISQIATTQTAPAAGATPLYVAPELLLGHAPHVQSDIYALGVMLYQLILGDWRRPLASGWQREIADELLQEDIADAANGSPDHRLTSAKDLADRLRNLEARRNERRRLKEQLENARSAQAALERTRARRPWLVGAVTALSLSLVTSLWFFRQTVLSRNEERRDTAVMRAVNDFLDNDLLAAANPNFGGSMDISVRDAIAKASNRIDSGFSNSPETVVVLHQTVGSAYRTLGQYADAEREFRSALSASHAAFGAAATSTLTSSLLLAQALAYENKYAEAQSLLAPIDTLAFGKEVLDPMVRVRLWDVHSLLDEHRTNRLSAAAYAEQTLAALEDMRLKHPYTYKANQTYVYLAGLHIGTAFEQAGQNWQAENILHRIAQDLATERGDNDPLTILAQQKWLLSLINLGKIPAALAQVPRLSEAVSSLGKHESPLELQFTYLQARLAAAQKNWNEAVNDSQTVESGYSRLYGVDNDATISAMIETARNLHDAGRLEESVAKYLEAYGLTESHQSDNELMFQLVRYQLAEACLDAGKIQQANLYVTHLNPAALAAAAPGPDWYANVQTLQARLKSSPQGSGPADPHSPG